MRCYISTFEVSLDALSKTLNLYLHLYFVSPYVAKSERVRIVNSLVSSYHWMAYCFVGGYQRTSGFDMLRSVEHVFALAGVHRIVCQIIFSLPNARRGSLFYSNLTASTDSSAQVFWHQQMVTLPGDSTDLRFLVVKEFWMKLLTLHLSLFRLWSNNKSGVL